MNSLRDNSVAVGSLHEVLELDGTIVYNDDASLVISLRLVVFSLNNEDFPGQYTFEALSALGSCAGLDLLFVQAFKVLLFFSV